MNKFKLILVVILLFLMHACMSPDYPCPLHDKPKACLSELAAYRDSEKTSQAVPIKQPLPYWVLPLKPLTSKPENRWFKWRGPM